VSAFRPQPMKPTHCAECGAARPTHDYATGECPTAYRPDTLGEALRELAAAHAARDQARLFAARGEVQRISGHHVGECTTSVATTSLCPACRALAATEEMPA
jgi:hypothetical protein